MFKNFKCLLFVVALVAGKIHAENLPTFPFLTVTGMAEMKVEPNKVNIEFRVIAFDKVSSSALAKVNDTAHDITEFLISSGISKKHISAYNISKDAKRNRHRESYQDLEILGYQVQQIFKVELLDIDKFEDVVNRLLVTDNLEGLNLSFDTSERQHLEEKLVAKAGKDAKKRAKNLAKGVGVDILSVFAVYEEGRGGRFNSGFDMERVAAFNQRSPRSASLNPPQFITLKKAIKVMYKIED